jgi:tetratricopeptide (TPR) repeat protein
MPARSLPLALVFLCISCGLAGNAGAQETLSPGRQFWEAGQEAMRQGHADEAIHCYERSLAADPSFARNHLSLAAAYLDKGDEAGACPHLALYLAANPDHLIVRVQYAELLLRLDRPAEARREFRRCAADAQQETDLHVRQLIHCHSRLMEIAEAAEDEYDEHLHRGIGLYLLARESDLRGSGGDDRTPEGTLCKAAAELTLARIQRPEEAQPCWYLYEVWSRLDQQRAAVRSLRETESAAPFTYLSPVEQSRLALALRRHDASFSPR